VSSRYARCRAHTTVRKGVANRGVTRHNGRTIETPSGGKLLLTTLNALFPLFHSLKDFFAAKESGAAADKLTFDLMTFRNRAEFTFTDDAGLSHTIETDERFYTPAEMRWLLQTAGFAKIDVYGCHIGQFSRNNPPTIDDFEMLVIAEKPE
jgi:hypothetical protein